MTPLACIYVCIGQTKCLAITEPVLLTICSLCACRDHICHAQHSLAYCTLHCCMLIRLHATQMIETGIITSPASALCRLGVSFAFLGSFSGDSYLVHTFPEVCICLLQDAFCMVEDLGGSCTSILKRLGRF